MTDVLIPSINAFLILDNDGKIIAKYYDSRSRADQIAFETSLLKKLRGVTFRSDAEILLLDKEVVVVRGNSDCRFAVSGPMEENEIILAGVVDTVHDASLSLLRGQLDKRTMLDNLELILLTIDEAIDHGHIMELDAAAICSRVLMRSVGEQSGGTAAVSSGDMTIGQALGIARNQFLKSLTTGGN